MPSSEWGGDTCLVSIIGNATRSNGANAVKDKTIRAVRLTRFNVCVVSMSCLSSDFTSRDDAQDSDNDLPLNPFNKLCGRRVGDDERSEHPIIVVQRLRRLPRVRDGWELD